MDFSSRQLGWMLFCMLLPLAAAQGSTTLLTQRANFKAAEQALQQGDKSSYKKLKASLKSYPLYPYLEYRELRWNLHKHKSERIEKFLTDYADTPLAAMLRNAWVDYLAKRGHWQSYLDFYQPSSKIKRQCNYLRALYKVGQKQRALSLVEPLWLHGKSQPDTCDPVFAVWRSAGMLTEKLVWQRIQLAMDARQTKLAHYLQRFLPQAQRQWLDRWQQVHRKPQVILSTRAFTQDHPYRNSILMHGVKRLARKDVTAARHAWKLLQTRYHFSAEQKIQAERALAFAMIRDKHPDTMAFLAQIQLPDEDIALAEARIRAALRDRNWPNALNWLAALPESQRQSEGWQYWKGRVMAELGRGKEAQQIFTMVAKERSYYGFLAADQQGSSYYLANIPLKLKDMKQQQIANLPAIRRAQELHALNRLTQARREWQAVTKDMTPDELQAAAKLAQSWGWHDRAIFSLARTGYWDDLDLRFPLKYRSQIEAQANTHQIDTAWIFAVVRQESAFIADAHSHKGAMGLMQLMPGTAKQLSTKLNGRSLRSIRSLLAQPDTNIRLGSSYLRLVLDKLDQHQVLATAAYNAGPYRVKTWLPDEDLPADLWVETVPFKETRSYLRRVLSYTVIYEQQLGLKPTRLQYRMPVVKGTSTQTVRLRNMPGIKTAEIWR